MKVLTGTIALVSMFAISAGAQMPNDYLDYFVVKVKPEKRMDFDGVMKRIADANRKNQGDHWLAFETEYGENNTVYIASPRKDFAAVDSANDMFMKAVKESFGAGFEGVLQEVNNCALSTRGELHRRRWDLSFNVPANPEDATKQLGAARWLRASIVQIRPGHTQEFEDLLRAIKPEVEKAHPSYTTLVSQNIAGANQLTYYISIVQPSFAGFDKATTSLREMMGEDAYRERHDRLGGMVAGTETLLAKFLPELSNPPEEIVNVSRDFWMPQTPVVTAARQKKKKAGQ